MTENAPRGERRQLDQYARTQQGGLLKQYWAFLRHRKLWYMLPIIGVLVLLGMLVFAGGTSIAPFLYTLF
jgi:hypothetical protein